MRRIVITVLVLALLAGTTAAFGLTQALKLERSPVTAPRFDKIFAPTCDCPSNEAQLALTLREADRIDAVIVAASGEPVRSLATRLERPSGVVRFSWDGRNEAGAVVPDGKYRLRIRLEESRRTIVVPNTVIVDATKPVVEIVRVSPEVFSPDGDDRKDRLRVRYRSSERAEATLFVDGVRAARTRLRRAGAARIVWRGKAQGRRVPPGFLRVSVELADEAGNVSDPSRALRARLRYIELASMRIRVPQRATVRVGVDTDALSFRWTLRRRSLFGPGRQIVLRGTGREGEVVIPLPGRVQPGRYTLRVAVNGFADEALVSVGRRSR